MLGKIGQAVDQHQGAVHGFFAEYSEALVALAERLHATFASGGKLLVCGNGGSACDAMHIAGEFCGRFLRERKGLPAMALSADSGILTAVGNDYGFDRIFARQIEALGKKGDMLIALSTSGSSANILAALEEATQHGLHRILFTGEKGRSHAGRVDGLFVVPSTSTARIQETHMLALHLLADMVETMMAEAG